MKIYAKDGKALKMKAGGGILRAKEDSGGETWVWNLNISDGPDTYIDVHIPFVSNNVPFTAIYISSTIRGDLSVMQYDDTIVNFESGWQDDLWRYITFAKPPTGALLTYLQANAVKQ